MNQKLLFFVLFSGFLFAQQIDSISIEAKLNTAEHTLKIKQEFFVYNHSEKVLTNFYLHAWANAYTGKHTVLNEVKLQDRDSDLYFADKKEKGGIKDLSLDGNQVKSYEFKNREFLLLNLSKPLKPKSSLRFTAYYTIKIPHEKITRYGYYENGDYLLKYFFLQPAPMKENRWILQNYKDFESVAARPTNYSVKVDLPKGYIVYSDLKQNGNTWQGKELDHFRLFFTKDKRLSYDFGRNEHKFNLEIGSNMPEELESNAQRLAKEQIAFLEQKLGDIPNNKLFISYKTKKEQNYFGVDDVDAWIVNLKLFTEEEKNALKLFQPLSYEYVDKLFSSDRRNDHWIKSGLQVYLQMRYVDEKFPELKLAGHIADSIKLFGLKPLKYFYGTKLKMNDRYKLLYLFMARQNFDQPIDIPIDELSNLNQVAMSSFKSGMSFYYLSEYLGEEHFDWLIRKFVDKYRGKFVTKNEFRNFMILNSKKDISWFFDDYIHKRDKINYALKKTEENEDSLSVKIKNYTEFKGPFKLIGLKNDSIINEQWYSSNQKNIDINFPKGDYDKLVLNPGYLFPEINDRDNYLKTKGVFKNGKKLAFKLYNDVANPEYNQVFILPQFRWNNYDKFLLGLTFKNSTPIPRKFRYSLSPKYSTGTNTLTGGGSLRYIIQPQEGWFRQIRFRTGYLFEHYDEDLAFTKLSAGTSVSFNKPFRSDRNHGISFDYDNVDREIAPDEIKTDEDDYTLWNLTYFYTNRRIIHDVEGRLSFQTTEQFSKLYSEVYYRWQVSKNYRIGFRFFGGKFLRNDTDTDFFDFGTNYITDYTFSYPLLGRSETEGLLSQQFVLADGGFKSDFDILVDDWLVSTNIEIPVWKMFDIFVDAGFYANEGRSTEFLYDTGIRVRVIPDFLELFFPIQSTLGFEPTLPGYGNRIRFTLNLNLARVISYLRRGQF